MKTENELISIIIPMYNCSPYFDETISSVIAQTYANWEALCVDDCSTDDTYQKALSYAEKDPRIKVYKNEKNAGPSLSRNFALEKSSGRYVAFLDSDDVWMPEKLQKQLNFMEKTGASVCITDYMTIEEDGTFRNIVSVPERTSYKQFLSNTLTCSHTVLIDTAKVDRTLLVMPDIKAGQDFAAWLQITRAGHDFYGLNEPLAKYRRHGGSISSNTLFAVKCTWRVYRDIEKLPLHTAIRCFLGYGFRAVKKRLPFFGKKKESDK